KVHVGEQQSPATVLPSSHCSPASRIPSPQTAAAGAAPSKTKPSSKKTAPTACLDFRDCTVGPLRTAIVVGEPNTVARAAVKRKIAARISKRECDGVVLRLWYYRSGRVVAVVQGERRQAAEDRVAGYMVPPWHDSQSSAPGRGGRGSPRISRGSSTRSS